jgi:hypothetical protein
MRKAIFVPACLLLLAASSAVRADYPSPDCCSTYPIYLCQPGYLGWPAPPRELSTFENCTGCNHGYGGATACGRIVPNPYTCCFYGVTLSNYGLITPLHAKAATTPSRLPLLPPAMPPEKLPEPEPR